MQSSKIFLSRYESFGFAAAEAGACGCNVFFNVRFLKNVSYNGELLFQNDKKTTYALRCHGLVAKSFITRFFP